MMAKIDETSNIISGGVPVVHIAPSDPTPEALTTDTPRRRSSRSRTKSPEPIIVKAQDPTLSAVPEEPDDETDGSKPTDTQMYEKIIDEMDVDDGNAQDVNEDELLADDDAKMETEAAPQSLPVDGQVPAEEKPETTEEENRGTKRRSDSPSKGNTPKKRQRLPPPNIEDFVNDEDEPELDESALQLSWCKFVQSALCYLMTDIFCYSFSRL